MRACLMMKTDLRSDRHVLPGTLPITQKHNRRNTFVYQRDTNRRKTTMHSTEPYEPLRASRSILTNIRTQTDVEVHQQRATGDSEDSPDNKRGPPCYGILCWQRVLWWYVHLTCWHEVLTHASPHNCPLDRDELMESTPSWEILRVAVVRWQLPRNTTVNLFIIYISHFTCCSLMDVWWGHSHGEKPYTASAWR